MFFDAELGLASVVWWPGMGGQTVAVLLSIHKNFPAFNDKNLLSITTHHTRKRRRRQELPCTGPKGGQYIYGELQSTSLVGTGGGWGEAGLLVENLRVSQQPLPTILLMRRRNHSRPNFRLLLTQASFSLWNRPFHVYITTVWLVLCETERLLNCKISKTKMPHSS